MQIPKMQRKLTGLLLICLPAATTAGAGAGARATPAGAGASTARAKADIGRRGFGLIMFKALSTAEANIPRRHRNAMDQVGGTVRDSITTTMVIANQTTSLQAIVCSRAFSHRGTGALKTLDNSIYYTLHMTKLYCIHT